MERVLITKPKCVEALVVVNNMSRLMKEIAVPSAIVEK